MTPMTGPSSHFYRSKTFPPGSRLEGGSQTPGVLNQLQGGYHQTHMKYLIKDDQLMIWGRQKLPLKNMTVDHNP